MIEIILHATLAIVAAFAALPSFAADNYPFAVRGDPNGATTILVASNRGPATVSVRVSVRGENVGSDRVFPVVARIPANSDVLIGNLFPARYGNASFTWSTEFMPGDIEARHDPAALYRMPYSDGDMLTLGQSPGGPVTTHTKPDSAFAVDISMPEGTPILASRDGVVIQAKGSNVTGGKLPEYMDKANFVEIQHIDGTVATYAHMMPHGVLVSLGQHVLAGTRIGLAGMTGYASGPHLHFAVQEIRQGDPDGTGKAFHRVSIPFRFYVGTPPQAFDPREGLQVAANYSGPAEMPTLAIQARSPTVASAIAPTQASSGTPSETGMRIYLEVPVQVAAFLRSIPAWVMFVAGVILTLAILALLRPRGGRNVARIEPWDREGR